MPSILIELTNRCNLSCKHCLDERHSTNGGNLKIEIIEKILQNGKDYEFDFLSFTGGEPTLHPRFIEILKKVYEAGYNFGFVTNGWNFSGIYKNVLPYRDRFTRITFSLDGAREETHDRLRGKGSYRRVMKAVSICVVKDIPFTINTAITSHNRGELREMAELATKLGSRGLRFGHLIPTPLNMAEKMNLSSKERRETEAIVRQLQKSFQIPIFMACGYYTADLFPCDALKMQEFNVDWRGSVTMCCHLSWYGDGVGNGDVIGNLDEIGFYDAYERLVEFNREFRKEKLEYHNSSKFKDSDYFPCWYCLNYFKKVDWLKDYA